MYPIPKTAKQIPTHTHALICWTGPYLVMLSGLNGLERADPVLHLFPVLSTEDEPTEWSDHLEAKGGRRYERVRQILWLNSERAQEKHSLMFRALSSSACGTSEWRTTGSVFKREQGCEAPLPLSLSPWLSLSYIHTLSLSLINSSSLTPSSVKSLPSSSCCFEADMCWQAKPLSKGKEPLSLLLPPPLSSSTCEHVCVCVCLKDSTCR